MIDLNTNNPITFKEFSAYNKDYNNVSELKNLYLKYLTDYETNKTLKDIDDTKHTSDLYKEYIKTVNIDNLHADVKGFLNKLDYDDPYELDLASHYIAENIQKEAERLRSYRDEIKFTPIKNNLKTSPKGIEIYLKNFIVRLLAQEDFLKYNTKVDSINLSEVMNKLSINFVRYVTNDITSSESNEDVDVLDRIDMDKSVKAASKTTLQSLKVRHKGKSLYLHTNTKKKVSVNVLYTDPLRLPERFFGGEKKTLENLTLTLNSKLYEKYLGADMYYLSGNSTDYELKKILTAESKNSYTNRYHPTVASDAGNKVTEDTIPRQLSFTNAGLATALSKNLTFNVNVSAVSGEYLLPDPNSIQSGVGLRQVKSSTPINFNAETSWIKNTGRDSIDVVDVDTLKSVGYQSKENSLDYNASGINRHTDEISFWTGIDQNIWKNDDVYKRSESLNDYPEAERYNDLLIKNETATILRNDVYGNEFVVFKSITPKRYAGTSYITAPSSIDITVHVCEVYDGLYFDSVLSAISAANPTKYTSLTAMYDTVLFNDVSTCSGLDGFYAPLSTAACSAISGDDLVDGGPFENHPCPGSAITVDRFTKNTNINFNNIAVPSGFTTSYELSTLNNPALSTVPLYNQNFVNTGSIYMRDINTQKVYTLYERLSGVFTKLPQTVQDDISANNIVNFDVVGNTLYVQTSANTFTESYDYDGEKFILSVPSISLI